MTNNHMKQLPAIEIKKLHFSHNKEPIFSGVELTVEQGDFLAIIGPNGGGKTTLLKIILGLLAPDKGTISIFGKKPTAIRDQIGYVSQFSTVQCSFPATLLEIILMGGAKPSFFGGTWSTKGIAKKRARNLLEILGLADMEKQNISTLSGGQRQRALVARALMGRSTDPTKPFLLLLDEPTASIDPPGKFCFYEFLNQLRGDITIIVVSHELLMASPFFSCVAFINRNIMELPENRLTAESISSLFGEHQHICPVGEFLSSAVD